MTSEQAARMYIILRAAYPMVQPSTDTASVYERLLLDLDAQDVEKGLCEIIATSRYFPSVSEIRSAAEAARRARAPSKPKGCRECHGFTSVHGRLEHHAWCSKVLVLPRTPAPIQLLIERVVRREPTRRPRSPLHAGSIANRQAAAATAIAEFLAQEKGVRNAG